MGNELKSKNGELEIKLFDSDLMVEIEHVRFKNVSLEINYVAGIANPLNPDGAIFKLRVCDSKEKAKEFPFEYGGGWIMQDGSFVKYGEQF